MMTSQHCQAKLRTISGIYVCYADKAGAATNLAKEILDKPEYDGKVVLICWEHKAILDLATALGIAAPPDWPGQTFDRLWIINLNSGKATLKQEPERLMYGDSAK